jgi:NAD(P)-dependent dehydrogenase (short-subunit alcohol dehydrogenase family)
MDLSILRDKRCLVTGATGGLGRELAKVFGAAGCRMFLTGRNAWLEECALATTGPEGNHALACAADLRDPAQLQALVDAVLEAWTGVDILLNCAGVFPVGPFLDSAPGAYEACFDLNVRAPLLLARSFGRGMAESGWGRVVNIASSSAYSGFRDTALYCASKHALLGLSRALHQEWKGSGVRVLCVSPGSIATDMALAFPGQDPATFLDPHEVAMFIADLVACDGNMVTEEIRLNRMEIR